MDRIFIPPLVRVARAGQCILPPDSALRALSVQVESVLAGGATSYFETGLAALLSMKAQTVEPHAEEARSAVSKYGVALAQPITT